MDSCVGELKIFRKKRMAQAPKLLIQPKLKTVIMTPMVPKAATGKRKDREDGDDIPKNCGKDGNKKTKMGPTENCTGIKARLVLLLEAQEWLQDLTADARMGQQSAANCNEFSLEMVAGITRILQEQKMQLTNVSS